MFSLRQCRSLFPGPTRNLPISRAFSARHSRTADASKRVPASLADFRMTIMAAANKGSGSEAFGLAKQMKLSGLDPDISIFNALLETASRGGYYAVAWAIFDDMLRAGVTPNDTSFTHLIHAQRSRPAVYVWRALQSLRASGVKPSPVLHSAIINAFITSGSTEGGLQQYLAMQAEGLMPEMGALQNLVVALADAQLPRLAIDVARAFESISQRRLEPAIWLACLASSGRTFFMDGVVLTWPLVTGEMGLVPDEGTCLSVLRTAARHGAPDLATEVLSVLKTLGVQWTELHFSAVVEGFCRRGQVKEALMTLQIMKDHHIIPTKVTTLCIIETALTDLEAIDDLWAVIDEIHGKGQPVDHVIRLIMAASVKLGDLQRVVGAYKALPDYNITPGVDDFHLVLDACLATQHWQLADMILADMKKGGATPDTATFTKLINVCLAQPTYEQAFFYLEEMKEAKILPPRDVYVAIIHKCWSVEDPRADMVLEELQECGYAPVRRPAEVASLQVDGQGSAASIATQGRIGVSAQEYINSGGV